MLVLSRSVGQDVGITLPDGRHGHQRGRKHDRLGFEAPSDIVIRRGEVHAEVDEEQARTT